MDAWRYFEKNPEAAAALVAAIAVIAGVVGARIQANAGRAQAAAAREAAEISAEAQRVAALWTIQQKQVAELIRIANSIYQKCNRLWNVADEELADQIGETSEELSLVWAEVRLVVTRNVATAAGELAHVVVQFETTTHHYAPVRHARVALARLTADGDDPAAEIARILAWGPGDPDRSEALCNLVPGLSDEHAYYLAAYHDRSDDYIWTQRTSDRRAFHTALNRLVHEARHMLRSEDDVTPRPARSRWWRRAA
ncbi:hypothetical protein ACIPM5_35080 [Streptomyces microflavus]|uniref:hypothetical protein n=1 Tax=Streptomyces microflavus TaxID=1919 RepID=UPI0038203704